MKFTIFGAGAWGTALAAHIANNGNPTILAPRRAEHAEALIRDNENKDYLPNISLKNISIVHDIKKALDSASVIFLACPSQGLRELCQQIKEHINHKPLAIITVCKGLDKESLAPPASLAQGVFPDIPVGVLSGPNNALEIAQGKPAATTLGLDTSTETLQAIQKALSSKTFRVYTSNDIIGVEYAGCLKNIYAIGSGILDGLRLGDNIRATYLTRALKELCAIGETLGGNPQTFLGLSGFGDLIATCYGAWSRNRTFGQAIAEGSSPKIVVEHQKTVVEGYWATKTFHDLLQKKGIEAPILNQLYAILYENKPPKEALDTLMTRDLKPELI